MTKKQKIDINKIEPGEAKCEQCSLSIAFNRSGYSRIWGEGLQESPDVVFVGEAPGAEEERQGIPFVGRSGQLMRSVLKEIGFKEDRIFITNICACRPVLGKEDRAPTDEEISCCLPRLVAQLDYMAPKLVIAVGGTAFKVLTGSSGNITNARGKLRSGRYPIFPILHPAYVLRNQRVLELFASDLETAYNLVYKNKAEDRSTRLIYVDNEEKLNRFELEFLHKASANRVVVSFDFETNSRKPWVKDLVVGLVGFCKDPDEKWVLPVDHPESPFRGNSRVMELIKRFCLDSNIGKVCHNMKYESGVCLNKFGVLLQGAYFDTMLAHYLFDPSAKGTHDLEYLAATYTHLGAYKSELEAYKTEHNIEGDYTRIPLSILVPYNGNDVEATMLLYLKFASEFKQHEKFGSVMQNLLIPASLSLSVLEDNGCLMDTDYLVEMHHSVPEAMSGIVQSALRIPQVKEFYDKKVKVKKRTKEQVSTFNINSNDQVGIILTQHLGYPTYQLTATGKPVVDNEALEQMKEMSGDPYKFIEMLQSYRELQKLKSTYIDAFLLRMDKDHILHSSFNMHVTDTGRLSSSDPNFQNIPVDPIVSVKRAFKSRFKGGYIIEADMSQMEVRMMCALCKDKTMREMIQSGKDFHTMAASYVYGVPEDQVTKDQRYVCKKVNWRLLFGGGAYGIHKQYKIPLEEAERIVSMYFKLFPDMKKYMDSIERFVRKNGYYESEIGRVRKFYGVFGSDDEVKKSLREALNFPIQSIASDITLSALNLFVLDYIVALKRKSKPFSIVHDSIIVDVHPDEVMEVVPTIYNIMTNIKQYTPLDMSFLVDVPIRSEVKIGRNWGDAMELPDSIVLDSTKLAELVRLIDSPEEAEKYIKALA